MARVVIDPITRIEGHLKIEVEVQGGKVTNAWSSSTLFRGIEIMLQGRDPRDAYLFTQRACGVCTYIHGLASIRSVDDAVGAKVAENGRLIRNLLHGSQYLHDHMVHFYHLHALDWVDIVSALKADPKKTADLAAKVSPTSPDERCKRFQGGAGPYQKVCRQRPARAFCQRLLGPPGIQAAAGSQPDGGCPLSCSFAATSPHGKADGHIRRQEPAYPEPDHRRGNLRHGSHPGQDRRIQVPVEGDHGFRQ